VYEVGGRRIGMRWSASVVADALRDVSDTWLRRAAAPPNISIVVGASGGRNREKHRMYVQGRLRLTTAHDDRLVRAVLRAIAALAEVAPTGAVDLDAVVLLDRDGRAVLVDRRLAFDTARMEPRLVRRGWRVVDVPIARVDADTATVTLSDARAVVGTDLRAFDASWPAIDGSDDLAPRRIPIHRIVGIGSGDGESLAVAVAQLAAMAVRADGSLSPADVAAIAEVARCTPCRFVTHIDEGALERALAA
jgi:hypothetical protein